ncbi:MAG: hypothetical protein LC785_11385 [Acidobacteria bacterium]|nr:hypothetical protein [Acidobacteriota bacterium]MCA1642528.1 hypothetical protein [Acidobacteriota bacterium]
MSLIYLHGELLMPFILGVLVLAALGWVAIIYMVYRLWRNRGNSTPL